MEDALFQVIRHLDRERKQWIKRTVATIDLAHGLDTYIEHTTYDLDPEFVSNIHSKNFFLGIKNKYLYLPIVWRQRETFLEFDALSNCGASLQLVELEQRERYCEWLFWKTCKKLRLLKHGRITDKLKECIRDHVHNGRIDDKLLSTCSDDDLDALKEITSNTKMKRIYDKIGDYQPVILRIPKNSDFTMLKLKERRTIAKPKEQRLSQRLRSSYVGTVYSVNAGRTKFIAPNDMRFRRVDGRVLRSIIPHAAIRADVFGDGSWAYCGTDKQGDFNAWRLTMTPRRSEFLSPGRRVLYLGIAAIIFWQIFNVSATSGNDILHSFSMTVIGSVFLYYLKLFDVKSNHSLLFRWATTFQRRGLMIAYGAIIIFPFLPHLFKRAGEGLNMLPNVLSSHLSAVIKFIQSENTASIVRWVIIAAVAILLIDFLIAKSYGKPRTGAN